MPAWPIDYVECVLNDVEKYNNVRQTIKAGIRERFFLKYVDPKKLHPNPSDEFSQAEVGPNLGIVSDYVGQIRFNQQHDIDIFEEPVIAQKMLPDGYLLLNGHHRWFAALRMGINKLHVKIVNVVGEEDVKRMLDSTNNDMLVSFDFDEVLTSLDTNNQAAVINKLFEHKFDERLRIGAPEVISMLQSKGYDVCIYTAGYLSEEEINDFFAMYDVTVNIILNGFNDKRKNNHAAGTKGIKDLAENKYKKIVHIDNESISIVNHETKELESYDIDGDWKTGIEKILAS